MVILLLVTQSMANNLCQVSPRDNRLQVVATSSVFIALAGFSLAMRMVARYIQPVKLWWDDTTVIIGLVNSALETFSHVSG